MKFGDVVGYSDSWPYLGAHPGCWQPPHKGTLVPYNDPRLWYDTLAFSARRFPDGPPQAEVDAHIAKCRAMMPERDMVGVVWEYDRYGNGHPGTDFYEVDKLPVVSYAEALATFRHKKAEALTEERRRRAARGELVLA